jgi:hypothetical protein
MYIYINSIILYIFYINVFLLIFGRKPFEHLPGQSETGMKLTVTTLESLASCPRAALQSSTGPNYFFHFFWGGHKWVHLGLASASESDVPTCAI